MSKRKLWSFPNYDVGKQFCSQAYFFGFRVIFNNFEISAKLNVYKNEKKTVFSRISKFCEFFHEFLLVSFLKIQDAELYFNFAILFCTFVFLQTNIFPSQVLKPPNFLKPWNLQTSTNSPFKFLFQLKTRRVEMRMGNVYSVRKKKLPVFELKQWK